jgi:excisionase family DNA binding protein
MRSKKAFGVLSDGLMTLAEAHDFSRLSRSDLYARMSRGELAFVKLGRRRLIPRRALMQLVTQAMVLVSGPVCDASIKPANRTTVQRAKAEEQPSN